VRKKQKEKGENGIRKGVEKWGYMGR